MSKIKTNTVSNLKALGSFTANLNGATAIITGANNSGKSSFIRSLIDRLSDIKPDIILKTGTEEGFQELELTTGEKLIWSFENKTAKGERLIFVTSGEDGKEVRQSLSQEIAKRFFPPTFDIDEFLQATPQKQKNILEKISGLDFSVINDRYKVAYEDRTLANSKLKDAKANLKPIRNDLPVTETDVFSIQQEIHGIDKHNETYATAQTGVDTYKKDVAETDKEIARLQTLINAANKKKKELETRVSDGEKWLSAPANKPKGDDVSYELNKKLQTIVDQNTIIRANNEAIKTKEDVLNLETKAKEADAKVKSIELEKVKMIKESNLPEGFDFTDDGILFEGLPVTKQQLSTSRIYIAALHLASMNLGEVKTLYFDASMLDKNSLAEVENWAITEGTKLFGEPIQLLIEKVDFEAGELRYELIETTA